MFDSKFIIIIMLNSLHVVGPYGITFMVQLLSCILKYVLHTHA